MGGGSLSDDSCEGRPRVVLSADDSFRLGIAVRGERNGCPAQGMTVDTPAIRAGFHLR
jgi:hypothetical protein